MNKNLVFAILLTGLLCTTIIAQSDETDESASAVILDEQITYKIKSNCSAELEVHKKIRVNNSRGEEYITAAFYESKYVKLDKFEAHIYDLDSNELKKYEKDDLLKICGFGSYSLYDDVCDLVTSISHAVYPYIVTIDYKEKDKTIFFWNDWYPQDDIPVKKSQYTLIIPDDFELNYYAHSEIPEPEIIHDGNKAVYTWTMQDIPKFDDADYIPNDSEERIKISFVPPKFKLDNYQFDACDWRTLGYNYLSMAQNSFEIDDNQKLLMAGIINTSSSQREICQKLHQALINKTRYVAIQIGIGGWLPTKSAETFFRGYGDCKDLAFLYVSMLRYANIEAYPVLIKTRDNGYLNPNHPRLNNFNHMILYAILDGDTTWIDATCQSCEIGDLPGDDENVYCLAITDTAGCLLLSSTSKAEDNIICRKARIDIGKKKSINARISYCTRGNPCQMVKSVINAGKKDYLDKLLKSEFMGLSDKFIVDKIETNDLSDSLDAFSIDVEGQVSKAVHKIRDTYYLKLDFLECDILHNEINLAERKYALDVNYPRTYLDSIHVNLPEGWTVEELPEPQTIETEFGKFSISLEIEDNAVLINRTFTNNYYAVETDKFAELEEFKQQIKDSDKLHLVLSDGN